MPAPVSRSCGSAIHVALHPSPPAVFPSSQDSPDSIDPLPHLAPVRVLELQSIAQYVQDHIPGLHTAPLFVPLSHDSPVCTIPSPQKVFLQVLLQLSPFALLPSSHSSPVVTTQSPQLGPLTVSVWHSLLQ